MLRTVLIGIVIACNFLFIFVAYLKSTKRSPVARLKPPVIDVMERSVPLQVAKELPAIETLRQKLAKVNSFSCEKMNVLVWENGHRFRLTGRMHFEKPLNFRMELLSIFGKELDLGANSDVFWYWSRRDVRPALYWAAYADYNKTRLKTPFNPVFMRASLGLSIPEDEWTVTQTEQNIVLTCEQKNAAGQPIMFSTFVSKDGSRIDGFTLMDQNWQMLAACEIQKHVEDVPAKIVYTWYEENRVMEIEFQDPMVNSTINPEMWKLPNHTPSIDMSNE